MSEGVTNNVRKRLSSILKRTDVSNMNQCDVKSSSSDNVEKSQRRKSKRVSFGRQTIQEIDKVSEIHRNWADSMSSDEGMSGLSDIGNLTSLKSKRSLDAPNKYELAKPPKNLSNVLSSTKGFKFFDNTNLNIDEEDVKENVESPVEQGLSAREFLRSHNLIKSDHDDKHALNYPDVNPPAYIEIMKSSRPIQGDSMSCPKVAAAQETNNENDAPMLSSKHFIQMASEKGQANTMEQSEMTSYQAGCCQIGYEKLNETDVDMEITTCIISGHNMDKTINDEVGRGTNPPDAVQQDVEMTSADRPTVSSVSDMETTELKSPVSTASLDDMEITCAVRHSNLERVASGNISNASTRTACVNTKSLAPSEVSDVTSQHDENEDMEFTCYVPMPSTSSEIQNVQDAAKSDIDQRETEISESDVIDLHLTTGKSDLAQTTMPSNGDDMEFTCVVSQKSRNETEESVSIDRGQIDESTTSQSLPKLSFNMSRLGSTQKSTPHPKNLHSGEVVMSTFSGCAQSIGDSPPATNESVNDSVFRRETSSNTVTNPTVIDNEEIQLPESKGDAQVQATKRLVTVMDKYSSIITREDESENHTSTDATADSVTEVRMTHQIHKNGDLNKDEEAHIVSENLCHTDDAENPSMTRVGAIPIETVLESVGLVLPKIPWNRDSVASAPLVEPRDKSLASLFEMKFCTPTQNDIRESAISQIEEILAWCESRIHQMKEESSGLPSRFLENEVVRQQLEALHNHCLAQAKIYWKQTKTKLYKGLTKALDEYVRTDLEEVCGKFSNANELFQLATEEARKRETEQRLDAPTAEQEDEINRLNQELKQLNSEIDASKAKIETAQDHNNEIKLLKEDITMLSKEWDNVRKTNLALHQKLADLRRLTGRKMSLETGKVLLLDFLNSTMELRVEMMENLMPWDWNNQIISYSFKFSKTATPSPANADLYAMINDLWVRMLPTDTLVRSHPNLKSLIMLMKELADLEGKFKDLIATGDWITSRLVCNYSIVLEERKLVVSFMAPRIGTDGGSMLYNYAKCIYASDLNAAKRYQSIQLVMCCYEDRELFLYNYAGSFYSFQIGFSFDQFLTGSQPHGSVAREVYPTSYNFVPGQRSWKDLQLSGVDFCKFPPLSIPCTFVHRPEHAQGIIDHACGQRISLRIAVEAILRHVDYSSKMFDKA